MMKLFFKMLHFLSIVFFLLVFNKLRIKRHEKWFYKTIANNLFQSMLILLKIEPEKTQEIMIIIKKINDQQQVNKMTGLHKDLDLSGLDKQEKQKSK